jgi:hypothetical protein
MKIGDKVLFTDYFYEHHKYMTYNRYNIFTIKDYFSDNFINIISLYELPGYYFEPKNLITVSEIRKQKIKKLKNVSKWR